MGTKNKKKRAKTMKVGKLKEYLDDIDDNVEIKGLRLYCESGFSIQSKTLYMDNSQRLEELENLQTKIMLSVNSGKYSDVFRKGMIEAFDIIDKRIEELKGEINEDA